MEIMSSSIRNNMAGHGTLMDQSVCVQRDLEMEKECTGIVDNADNVSA